MAFLKYEIYCRPNATIKYYISRLRAKVGPSVHKKKQSERPSPTTVLHSLVSLRILSGT